MRAKTAADNTIARIIELVEQAQASKAPTARFIEKFSRYYTPAVMALSLLVIIIPPLVLGGVGDLVISWFGTATDCLSLRTRAINTGRHRVWFSCWCASRLLIKGGSALEIIGRVNTVAFDKTGTLTEGKPRVTDVVAFASEHTDFQSQDEILALFASVESASNHPLAKAIIDHAKAANIVIPIAANAYATAGKAVHATVAERSLAIGSPVYAADEGLLLSKQQAQIESLQNEGKLFRFCSTSKAVQYLDW